MLFDRKNLEAISGGHWVTGKDLSELGDGKIKVRGFTSEAARDAFEMKARAATAADRLPDGQLKSTTLARHTRELLSEVCIVDADGLGFTADELREMVLDAAYENLIGACLGACMAVDRLTEEGRKAVSGN